MYAAEKLALFVTTISTFLHFRRWKILAPIAGTKIIPFRLILQKFDTHKQTNIKVTNVSFRLLFFIFQFNGALPLLLDWESGLLMMHSPHQEEWSRFSSLWHFKQKTSRRIFRQDHRSVSPTILFAVRYDLNKLWKTNPGCVMVLQNVVQRKILFLILIGSMDNIDCEKFYQKNASVLQFNYHFSNTWIGNRNMC